MRISCIFQHRITRHLCLKKLLADTSRTKLFHFARFDVAILLRYLEVRAEPIYCTKIASRLARSFTDRHSFKDLCRELIGVDISKAQQSSDWGAASLSKEQVEYAASDVLYLHRLREKLEVMLLREKTATISRSRRLPIFRRVRSSISPGGRTWIFLRIERYYKAVRRAYFP